MCTSPYGETQVALQFDWSYILYRKHVSVLDTCDEVSLEVLLSDSIFFLGQLEDLV